jgi:hypothetical protein
MAWAQASPSVAAVPQTTQAQASADIIPAGADLAAYAAIALAQGKVIISPGAFPPPAKGFTHYLVTLKPDADPHQWDKELAPTHHYSHALKGFRAQLTAEQYKKLKAHKQVVAIEPDTAIRPAVVSNGPAHCRLVPLITFRDPQGYRAAFKSIDITTGGTNDPNPIPDSSCMSIFEFPSQEEMPSGVFRMGVSNFSLAHIDGGDHQLNVGSPGITWAFFIGWFERGGKKTELL